MFKRLGKWLSSFTGALFMAVFSFVCILNDVSSGNTFMAWVMGIVTMWWLYVAYKATKKGDIDLDDTLTDDQKARIKTATREFHAVLKEVDDEMQAKIKEDKAEALAQVLKDKEKK